MYVRLLQESFSRQWDTEGPGELRMNHSDSNQPVGLKMYKRQNRKEIKRARAVVVIGFCPWGWSWSEKVYHTAGLLPSRINITTEKAEFPFKCRSQKKKCYKCPLYGLCYAGKLDKMLQNHCLTLSGIPTRWTVNGERLWITVFLCKYSECSGSLTWLNFSQLLNLSGRDPTCVANQSQLISLHTLFPDKHSCWYAIDHSSIKRRRVWACM